MARPLRCRLELGPKLPCQGVVVERLEEPGRNVNAWVPVAPRRLDQQHPGAGVLGQPVGQDATRRTRTDDDVIRLHIPRSLRARVRSTARLLTRAHSLAPGRSERWPECYACGFDLR